MNGISALTKVSRELAHALSTMQRHSEKMVIYDPERDFLPDTESSSALISVFQPPELWEIDVCDLSHSIYGIYGIASHTD